MNGAQRWLRQLTEPYLSGHVDANEEVMRMVADYIARNPDSNFASMAKKCGNRFVMVSSLGWGIMKTILIAGGWHC